MYDPRLPLHPPPDSVRIQYKVLLVIKILESLAFGLRLENDPSHILFFIETEKAINFL